MLIKIEPCMFVISKLSGFSLCNELRGQNVGYVDWELPQSADTFKMLINTCMFIGPFQLHIHVLLFGMAGVAACGDVDIMSPTLFVPPHVNTTCTHMQEGYRCSCMSEAHV